MQHDHIRFDRLKEPGYLSQVFADERLLSGDTALANLMLHEEVLRAMLGDKDLIMKLLQASADSVQYIAAMAPMGGGDGASEALPRGHSLREKLGDWITNHPEDSSAMLRENAKEAVTALLGNNSFITILKEVKPKIYQALLQRLQEGGYADSPEIGPLLTQEIHRINEDRIEFSAEGGFTATPEYYRILKADVDKGHFGRFQIHLRQLERGGEEAIRQVLDFERGADLPKLSLILYEHFDHDKAREALFRLLKIQDPKLETPAQDQQTLLGHSLALGDAKLAAAIAANVAPEELDPVALYGNTPLITLLIDKAPEAARIMIARTPAEKLAFAQAQGSYKGSTSLQLLMYRAKEDPLLQTIEKLRDVSGAFTARDKYGRTALMYAADYSSLAVTEALLREMSPEEVAMKDNSGSHALLHATAFGNHNFHADKAMKLMEKMPPEALADKNAKGRTTLENAIFHTSFRDDNPKATNLALALVEKIPATLIPLDIEVNLDSGTKTACILEHITSRCPEEIGLALVQKVPERVAPYLNQAHEIVSYYTSYPDNKTTFLQIAIDKGYKGLALEFIKIMTPEALGLQNHLLSAVGESEYKYSWESRKKMMPEVAEALIGKMRPQDLALRDEKGNIALIRAMNILNNGYEPEEIMCPVILKMIAKMHPHDFAQRDEEGNTALIRAVNISGRNCKLKKPMRPVILEMIEKMPPEIIAAGNNEGETALESAKTDDFEISLAILKKAKMHHPAEKLSGMVSRLQESLEYYSEQQLELRQKSARTQELIVEIEPSWARAIGEKNRPRREGREA